jgi:hypothetical protein
MLGRSLAASCLLAALPALPGPAVAQPAAAATAAPRGEVAVREVILTDQTRRYSVPIKVGSVAIEAGLDTGSTGLRVLPGVLGAADAKESSRSESYSYGAGAQLDGVAGDAVLSIGGVSGASSLELVREVGCSNIKSNCAAGRVSIAQYGIQGDGLPDQGFKAILGTNMASTRIANPFIAMGVRRWIVELPRPGEHAPGRIVLNPTDAEVEGFTLFKLDSGLSGGMHDALSGCLINGVSKAKVCGPVTLDSGAPGIHVQNAGLGHASWQDGAPATLAFYDAGGRPLAAVALSVGQRSQASHVEFSENPRRRGVAILSGLTVYFAYSVLYDAEHQAVGLKARPPAPGGPKAFAPAG